MIFSRLCTYREFTFSFNSTQMDLFPFALPLFLFMDDLSLIQVPYASSLIETLSSPIEKSHVAISVMAPI